MQGIYVQFFKRERINVRSAFETLTFHLTNMLEWPRERAKNRLRNEALNCIDKSTLRELLSWTTLERLPRELHNLTCTRIRWWHRFNVENIERTFGEIPYDYFSFRKYEYCKKGLDPCTIDSTCIHSGIILQEALWQNKTTETTSTDGIKRIEAGNNAPTAKSGD